VKLVKEHINEKFEEKSDPIKDMGIGGKPFLILVDQKDEEWQISPGIDIVIASSKEHAKQIWESIDKEKYYYNPVEIREIIEIDMRKEFQHYLEPSIE
jgi:hypothetical protein